MTEATAPTYEQGSQEWVEQRLGKVTASRVADVIAQTKNGPAASRENYLAELVAERLTGLPYDNGFTSAAMQHGIEHEKPARDTYEWVVDKYVTPASFIPHPTIEMAGASPDGVVGDDGLLEIKCPNTSTHISYMLKGTLPTKYKPQVQFQLACAQREWSDFASYDPRMPDNMKLWTVRVYRNEDYIKEMEEKIVEFLGEVEGRLKLLTQRFG